MSTRIILRISDDQAAAIAAYIKQKRKQDKSYEFSHEHRKALMRAIGRADLAKQVLPRGPKPAVE